MLTWLFLKFSQTNKQFLEELELLSLPVTRYAPQTYDAVWAIALALHGAQQKWETREFPTPLHHFDYTRRDMSQEFLSQLGQLDFLGVSVSSVESSTLH
jgi:gamma-aminobutyric acid type B receptor